MDESQVTVVPHGTRLELARTDVSEMSAGEVREKAKKLGKFIGMANSIMMELLWTVERKSLYRRWGYERIGDWVESEVRFSARKAQNFIQIWEKLVVGGPITAEEIDEVSWTSLRVIATAVNQNNVGQEDVPKLVAAAKGMRRDQFKDHVKGVIRTSGVVEKIGKLIIYLPDEIQETWNAAVQKVRGGAGRHKDNPLPMASVLEAMALSVLMSDHAKAEHQLAFYIRALERIFPGRRVVSVDERFAEPFDEFVRRIQEDLVDDVPAKVKK